jgi:ParB family chromosome partitioning protein
MSTNSRANDTQVQIGFDGNHYPLSNLVMVDLEKIDSNPYQPREEITLESVSDLARGIALKRRTLPQTCGLMQVPIARRIGDRVELAFGHRRNLAFEFNLENDGQYDWSRMPLNLQELSDEEMYDFACRENSDRQDLNDIERALAIRRGIDDFGWTLSQAANANGLSKSAGSNLLTLLLLPDAVQESVRMGHLGQRHARELARLMKHDPPLENVCERLETMARREAWTAVQVQDAVNEELKQAERESFRETRYCQKCGQGREFTGIEMDGPAYVTCESCQWQHNAIAWLP